ncbi:MAG: DUF1295 domain-containing protein [bacterium]|nr:DUF1295 domain-containing protein [bacterium]
MTSASLAELPLLLILLTAVFLLLWLLQWRTRNASWADAGWAVSVGTVMGWWLVQGEGDTNRRLLAGLLIALWTARLGLHLLRRAVQPAEDGRFRAMRLQWGERAQKNFLRYFLLQVPLVLLFALPAAALADDPRALQGRDLLGLVLGLCGLLGVSLADAQLHRHRSKSEDVCQTGLWRYSRHPNYFFEWMFWCCWPWMAPLTLPGLLAWITPVAAYLLLTRVTGIPPAERRALQRRGDLYRRYQMVTSSFFPRPLIKPPISKPDEI